jgi:hypothetical protein
MSLTAEDLSKLLIVLHRSSAGRVGEPSRRSSPIRCLGRRERRKKWRHTTGYLKGKPPAATLGGVWARAGAGRDGPSSSRRHPGGLPVRTRRKKTMTRWFASSDEAVHDPMGKAADRS